MAAKGPIVAIVLGGLKELVRDKTGLFWILVFPVIMVLISGGLWANPNPRPTPVGVYVEDSSSGPFNATLVTLAMEETGMFEVKHYDSLQSMLDDIAEDGDPPLGLYFPQGFAANASSGQPANLVVYRVNVSELWVEVDQSKLLGFLSGMEDRVRLTILEYALPHAPPGYRGYLEALADPLKTRVEKVNTAREVSQAVIAGYMAISMVVVEALFIGLNMGASMIHEERETGGLRALLSSPVPSWAILAGYTLTTMVYIALAGLASMAAGLLVGAEYRGLTPGILAASAVMVVLAGLFTMGLGLLLAPLARSTKGANGLATAIAFPLMFLGGIWIPAWMLPEPFRTFAHYFPLSRLSDALKLMIVYGGTPLEALSMTPPVLLAAIIAVYAVGTATYRRMLSMMVERA